MVVEPLPPPPPPQPPPGEKPQGLEAIEEEETDMALEEVESANESISVTSVTSNDAQRLLDDLNFMNAPVNNQANDETVPEPPSRGWFDWFS